MVCVTEFRRLVWLRVEILIVCLLAWSRPFAMAEKLNRGFRSQRYELFDASQPF